MTTATKHGLFGKMNNPIKGALSRLFGRPFHLTLGKRQLVFSNPADFEFALGGRVAVSLIKVIELLHRPAASLRRETVAIRLIEHNLMRVVEQCRDRPERISPLLRDLGVRSFSTDYRWRAIFEALAAGGSELNDYRQIAVVKYLQYLSARRDAIGIVYYHKTGKALEEERITDVPIDATDTSDADAATVPRATSGMAGHKRLPRNQAVVIRLEPNQDFTVYLADRPVSLRIADGLSLIDEHGRQHTLAADGPSTIGRAIGNDVTIAGHTPSVSRKHLIVEPLNDNRIRLTDLSARGTYVSLDVSMDLESSAAAA